jgi:serine/threonine protein kinase
LKPKKDKSVLLGKGSYGNVYSIMVDGEPRAIKVYKSNNLTYDVVREISALNCVDHPNIIKIIDVSIHSTGGIAILMPLYEMTLRTWIDKNETYNLPQSEIPKQYKFRAVIVSIMNDCLAAVHHLHSAKIIHRDIKEDNVLISGWDGDGTSDPQNLKVVLCDFGFATSEPTINHHVYTITHRPIEIHKREAYTMLADVYALGCVYLALLTGVSPYFIAKSASGRRLTSAEHLANIAEVLSHPLKLVIPHMEPLIHNMICEASLRLNTSQIIASGILGSCHETVLELVFDNHGDADQTSPDVQKIQAIQDNMIRDIYRMGDIMSVGNKVILYAIDMLDRIITSPSGELFINAYEDPYTPISLILLSIKYLEDENIVYDFADIDKNLDLKKLYEIEFDIFSLLDFNCAAFKK